MQLLQRAYLCTWLLTGLEPGTLGFRVQVGFANYVRFIQINSGRVPMLLHVLRQKINKLRIFLAIIAFKFLKIPRKTSNHFDLSSENFLELLGK